MSQRPGWDDLSRAQRRAEDPDRAFAEEYAERQAREARGGPQARGHARDDLDRAIRDPQVVSVTAIGGDPSPRTGRFRRVDYVVQYADDRPNRVITLRGRALAKARRQDLIDELRTRGVPFISQYVDANLAQREADETKLEAELVYREGEEP